MSYDFQFKDRLKFCLHFQEILVTNWRLLNAHRSLFIFHKLQTLDFPDSI